MSKTVKFIALDLGVGGVKMAAFVRHRSGQLELVDYRFKTLDTSSSVEMAPEAVLASVIKKLLSEMCVSSSVALVSVGGHAVFSRLVSLPPVSPDKLKQMIQHEAVQTIPFPIDEVVWDYKLSGDEGEALLVAVRLALVEGLAFAVEATGLSVGYFDTAPSSLYSAVRFSHPELIGSSLVVDMGAQSVDLIFMEGDRAFFIKLPIDGNKLTVRDLSNESTRQLFIRITQEIWRSILFYTSTQRGSAPELILLSGGIAGIEGIETLLSQRLNLPVERLDPLQKIKLGPKVDAMTVMSMSHRFGELVGLAVVMSGGAELSFNLMPPTILKARAFRKRQWLMVSCAVVLVMIEGVWAVGLVQLSRLAREELVQVTARVSALEGIRSMQWPIEKELVLLQRDRDVYLRAVKQHRFWVETLRDLKAVIPTGMFLTSLDPVFMGEGATKRLRGLRMVGIAYLDKHGEDDAIKKLRNGIRQSARFSDETDVVRSPAKKLFAREFEIEAILAESIRL